MANFTDESVADALERSIRNAPHLRARHSAAVAAARALARKIDAWDEIVEWANDDAAETGGRPKVPANDNVSIASFGKYLDMLGLMPDDAPAAGGSRAAASTPKAPNQIEAMRKKLGRG
ncbi:hypothetical protein ABTZ44_07610 [Microbacterium oxydans]|uniref:terminase small subunit n=1 Tax=Microbacterium oxydans TaxID=82380 RepID=UPI003329C089|nr:hypothetical protein [Microbacterium oxydans]